MTLQYHDPISTKDGYTLSVDNIVADFAVTPKTMETLGTLLDGLSIKYAVQVTYWFSGKIGSFKHNFKIQMQDGSSFWLGCVLNAGKPVNRVRLDANPNKVAQHQAFQTVLSFLIQHTRLHRRTVKRFDLAVDIPVERSDVFLVKDNRAYLERRHGREYTQYLGAKSSTAGRVKLYNKQIEAKLDYPLTRLELTLNPEARFEDVKFPAVYYITTMQTSLDELKITDTERFIIGAILQGYGAVTDLGRKTRAKITRLLADYVKEVKISPQDYEEILRQVRGYVTDQSPPGATDKDQPPDVPGWVAQAEQSQQTELPL